MTVAETLPSFAVDIWPSARQEAERRGFTLQPERTALDALAQRLRLAVPLPDVVNGIVEFDPSVEGKDILPSDIAETADGTVLIPIKTQSLDEPVLTYRVAEAMFCHPLLNPPVAEWYKERERQRRISNAQSVGGIAIFLGGVLSTPIAEHIIHNGSAISIGIMAGGLAAGIAGVVKGFIENNRRLWNKPRPAHVADMEPPIRTMRKGKL